MQPIELTLIVAATRSMGIGANGTLPWTGLKKEMAYFARVTKRPPRQSPPNAINAVIMGRKTWESIPPRFRPLNDRLNIVISRTLTPSSDTATVDGAPVNIEADAVRVASLADALAYLRDRPARPIGHVFVIGGAQIYAAALERSEARRVLLTKVMSDFACDTRFPIVLDDAEGAAASSPGWERRPHDQLSAWVGEAVSEGVQVENGTDYGFQMWERVDDK